MSEVEYSRQNIKMIVAQALDPRTEAHVGRPAVDWATDEIVKIYENRDSLFRLFAFDDTDSLWWRGTEGACDGDLRFFVNVNDVFYWGTADVEEIELPQDLEGLAQAKRDCPEKISYLWPILWACRKRGERPQGAMYKGWDEDVQALFDACGPNKVTGLGNPVGRPDDGK